MSDHIIQAATKRLQATKDRPEFPKINWIGQHGFDMQAGADDLQCFSPTMSSNFDLDVSKTTLAIFVSINPQLKCGKPYVNKVDRYDSVDFDYKNVTFIAASDEDGVISVRVKDE